MPERSLSGVPARFSKPRISFRDKKFPVVQGSSGGCTLPKAFSQSGMK
jgi:hypothetical protein